MKEKDKSRDEQQRTMQRSGVQEACAENKARNEGHMVRVWKRITNKPVTVSQMSRSKRRTM
jgi:hypothetical protein